MKHVLKQQEPAPFMQWKQQANDEWQPTYSDLRGEVKAAVKSSLMQEQGYICCYCERRLTGNDAHIEHFQPQSRPDVDALDYGNLLCACQQSLEKGEPLHCGNLKADWFSPDLLVSPLDPRCEGRFAFAGDGLVTATDVHDVAAATTITKLGLDIPKLNELRASAIEPFLDDDLTKDEMSQFVTGYLQQGPDNHFGEFWTTIKNLFGDFVAA